MRHAVAGERAIAGESSRVRKLDASCGGRVGGQDHGQVEVDQTAVVAAVALTAVDAVRIGADAARWAPCRGFQNCGFPRPSGVHSPSARRAGPVRVNCVTHWMDCYPGLPGPDRE